MSKPLELIVFAKEPGRYGGEPRYHSPDGLWAYPESHVDGYADAKRFTDAELAAEIWHSIVRFHGLCPSLEATKEASRNCVIERFATLPHYDEAQS